MLIMGHPQFTTQDDDGIGDGIPPIPEWQLESTAMQDDLSELSSLDIDYPVWNVFRRLRNVFQRAQRIPLTSTRLHDLTCFVVHRLLLSDTNTASPNSSPVTGCIRYAIILYMFIIQGPTYYSHAVIVSMVISRLMDYLRQLESTLRVYSSLDIWLLAVGMVASSGTTHYLWFVEKAQSLTSSLQLSDCKDALVRIKSVLWLEVLQVDDIFRPHWDAVLSIPNQEFPDFTVSVPQIRTGATFLWNTPSPTKLTPD